MAESPNRFRPLWVVGLMPLGPQFVGSAFDIWYNSSIVLPLLTPEQRERFALTTLVFNAIVFPLAILLWVGLLVSLARPVRVLRQGGKLEPRELDRARRLTINLPWWGALIAGGGWFLCIPSFLISLSVTPAPLDPHVFVHLPVSFIISGMIATTQSFFLIEITTQRVLFPVLFRDARADQVAGAWALSVGGRGSLWVISAAICPILSLVLIILAPEVPGAMHERIALMVGAAGMVFGVISAMLLHRLVVEPITAMRAAAQTIARGDLQLHAQIDLQRADEFGLLIWEFNRMVDGLREKQRLQETFGMHVGRRAAERIVARDPKLAGVEETITVMFVDIRNFTRRCEESEPVVIVAMLNRFLSAMVEVVETRHGGMINKFLGDGFMAIFDTDEEAPSAGHAARALACAREMLERLGQLNAEASADDEKIAIGIGLHTGPAIVGNIGSRQRREFTAIGRTVNLASRVESLTKQMGEPILLTAATRDALPFDIRGRVRLLAPQAVKGIEGTVELYAPDSD